MLQPVAIPKFALYCAQKGMISEMIGLTRKMGRSQILVTYFFKENI